MFKVNVKKEIIEHCKNQVTKYNFGNRCKHNGTKEQQLTGIIGESVILDLFNKEWVNGGKGFDDGLDILFNNYRIDVKTMGRKTEVKKNYTNNFNKLQDYLKTDIYIFCSYHKTKKELTVCGWIDKKTFKEKRQYYPKGTIRKRTDGSSLKVNADLYEIAVNDLIGVFDFEDMKWQLCQ